MLRRMFLPRIDLAALGRPRAVDLEHENGLSPGSRFEFLARSCFLPRSRFSGCHRSRRHGARCFPLPFPEKYGVSERSRTSQDSQVKFDRDPY